MALDKLGLYSAEYKGTCARKAKVYICVNTITNNCGICATALIKSYLWTLSYICSFRLLASCIRLHFGNTY